MLHIALDSAQLAMSKQAHFQAICGYLRKKSESYRKDLFQAVTAVVPCQQSFDEVDTAEEWSWLEKFILADVAALKKMTENEQALKFDQFLKLYKNRFCAGAKKYVDDVTQYNGYTFIKNLHITVCPYCDAEYLDVLESGEKGTVRTLEIDHYFPKKRYPGLAMCFYNLVPSGQGCNGIKLEQSLGMNPFETDIEAATKLYPDLPIGINMENVPVEDCTIRFHPRGGMVENVDVLRLEERYERHKEVARELLLRKQQYNDEKIEEMIKASFFESREQFEHILFGEPSRDQVLQKLRRDILACGK